MARAEIFEAAYEAMCHEPDGPVGRIMERAAYAVENEAKLKLLTPGTGREYDTRFFYTHMGGEIYLRQAGHRPPHRASAPEEPAASDTGMLLGSVTHEMGEGVEGVEAHVGSPTKVALYTELGTREVPPPGPGMPGHHGMVERPWLRPSLDILKVTPLS